MPRKKKSSRSLSRREMTIRETGKAIYNLWDPVRRDYISAKENEKFKEWLKLVENDHPNIYKLCLEEFRHSLVHQINGFKYRSESSMYTESQRESEKKELKKCKALLEEFDNEYDESVRDSLKNAE